MKRVSGILMMAFLFIQVAASNAQSLSQEDRTAAKAYLKETSEYFLDHVNNLSDTQLNYRAAPDKWTVRQCMEHIALSESFLFQLVQKSLAAPANPEKKIEVKTTVESLKTSITDRSRKGQSPEPIRPAGQFQTKEAAIQAFVTERNKHIDYLDNTSDDLHGHLFAHPFFGMLDAYQWIILMAGHSKRHTLQIEEVMASPGFPKS